MTRKRTPTKLSHLTADPKNARRHTPRNVGTIVSSLKAVGAARSIVIDERGRVLAGNATVEAAAKAGVLRVKVVDATGEELVAVRRTGLTRSQKVQLGIADNRTSDLSSFDGDRVRAFAGEGIELSAFFDEPELAALDDAVVVKPKPGKADPEKIPKARRTSIKAGHIFQLGTHRLVCGDCRDANVIASVAEHTTVPLVLTDPPYCSGGFQEAGRAAGTFGDIAADNLSTRGYVALIKDALLACHPQTIYIFTDWRMWNTLFDVVEGSGLAVRTMIVWDKETPGLGALWRSQHELIMFGSRKSNKRRKGQPANSNVLRVSRSGNVHHYTEKPVQLLTEILTGDACHAERHTIEILDPFLGSGSTIIAAEQLGRACLGIEVEPRYCQVTIDRWEQFTGKKATKIGAVEAKRRPAS
ncbi:hypothetical protein LCGC14_0795610 [marine sediment metagenome]|uniref:DNA methylase N-4/N-6 domain-containing protein n=1 Tax=marine sediment metagenome TaxID=412755 RepID=A0A0F9QB46_9ZZZZ